MSQTSAVGFNPKLDFQPTYPSSPLGHEAMLPHKVSCKDRCLLGLIYIAKRSIFVISLVCLLLLTLVQSFKCLDKYLDKPTYISSAIVDQYEADFPEVSLCSSGPFAWTFNMTTLNAYGYKNLKKYIAGIFYWNIFKLIIILIY